MRYGGALLLVAVSYNCASETTRPFTTTEVGVREGKLYLNWGQELFGVYTIYILASALTMSMAVLSTWRCNAVIKFPSVNLTNFVVEASII